MKYSGQRPVLRCWILLCRSHCPGYHRNACCRSGSPSLFQWYKSWGRFLHFHRQWTSFHPVQRERSALLTAGPSPLFRCHRRHCRNLPRFPHPLRSHIHTCSRSRCRQPRLYWWSYCQRHPVSQWIPAHTRLLSWSSVRQRTGTPSLWIHTPSLPHGCFLPLPRSPGHRRFLIPDHSHRCKITHCQRNHRLLPLPCRYGCLLGVWQKWWLRPSLSVVQGCCRCNRSGSPLFPRRCCRKGILSPGSRFPVRHTGSPFWIWFYTPRPLYSSAVKCWHNQCRWLQLLQAAVFLCLPTYAFLRTEGYTGNTGCLLPDILYPLRGKHKWWYTDVPFPCFLSGMPLRISYTVCSGSCHTYTPALW